VLRVVDTTLKYAGRDPASDWLRAIAFGREPRAH
jgi:hypothetical protein